jgi:hypothetical protein
MKIFLTQASQYTFAPGLSGVGTITFAVANRPSALGQILAIANVANGAEVAIYDPSSTGLGTTGYVSATGVLTLQADTSTMNASDPLYIVYDDSNTYTSVVGLAGENFLGKTGASTFNVQASFARPNDTNIYASGDVVADSTTTPTIMQFNVGRLNGGSGVIEKLIVISDNKNQVNRFRLYLWKTSITMQNDNAQFQFLYANSDNFVGFMDVPSLFTGSDTTNSTGSIGMNNFDILPFTLDSSDTKLYGLLVTLEGYTPVANTNYKVKIFGKNF